MSTTSQIAKNLRAVYNGGNWTGVCLKDTLNGITWEQAITKVSSFNTIVTLLYHMNYYVEIQIKVLKGGPLEGNDKLSFDHPPVVSKQDWESVKSKIWADMETFAILIEQLPDSKLEEFFAGEKYGTYFRNLTGLIEHNHYHLGQISLIRKMLLQKN